MWQTGEINMTATWSNGTESFDHTGGTSGDNVQQHGVEILESNGSVASNTTTTSASGNNDDVHCWTIPIKSAT